MKRLRQGGFTNDEIARVFEPVPVATHNQRHRKRPHRLPGGLVVEKAHMRPRFLEDCVREMIRMAIKRFGALDASTLSGSRTPPARSAFEPFAEAAARRIPAELGSRAESGR